MSQIPPPQQPTYVVASKPTNTLGVISCWISIVGIVSAALGLCCLPFGLLGLVSALGLILGLVALRREPRGWAIAGVIVGGLGTILALLTILIFGAILGVGVALVKQTIETNEAILRSESVIEQAIGVDGMVPSDAEGKGLIAGEVDGWDNELRYERLSETHYDITSSGLDGIFDTDDDIDRSSAQQNQF